MNSEMMVFTIKQIFDCFFHCPFTLWLQTSIPSCTVFLTKDRLFLFLQATEDFYSTFDKMMEYVKKEENLEQIEHELRNRKVRQ